VKGLLTALLIMATAAMGRHAAADDGRLSADEALHRADAGELVIIDVRSPLEWRRTGLPAGAVPATIHNSGGPEAFLREVEAALNGDRDRPVALICASGGRSRAAQSFLAGRGFTDVYDIAEGMHGGRHGPGWLSRRLPTQPCTSC
jgi:rhodanese-related sulfurtransferase